METAKGYETAQIRRNGMHEIAALLEAWAQFAKSRREQVARLVLAFIAGGEPEFTWFVPSSPGASTTA